MMRAVELWWWDRGGATVRVGLLVRSADEWTLLADERTPGLREPEVLRRASEAVGAFIGEAPTSSQMQLVLHGGESCLPKATVLLAQFAVNVCQRVGVLDGQFNEA
jgi:hypothetical protein